jgi:hypothetical protein
VTWWNFEYLNKNVLLEAINEQIELLFIRIETRISIFEFSDIPTWYIIYWGLVFSWLFYMIHRKPKPKI